MPALITDEPLAELREAAARVLVARRFYNDAVRDTRALRARRIPRVFKLAGHVQMPQFFDIDDTVPVPIVSPPVAHRPVTDPPSVGSQTPVTTPTPTLEPERTDS